MLIHSNKDLWVEHTSVWLILSALILRPAKLSCKLSSQFTMSPYEPKHHSVHWSKMEIWFFFHISIKKLSRGQTKIGLNQWLKVVFLNLRILNKSHFEKLIQLIFYIKTVILKRMIWYFLWLPMIRDTKRFGFIFDQRSKLYCCFRCRI